jgi:hypothetical protein
MPSEEMKMDYCVGAGGRTLRVGVVGGRGLEILVGALREMAKGRVDVCFTKLDD